MKTTSSRAATALAVAAGVLSIAPSALAAEETQPSGSAWEFLRAKYYGDKPMGLVDEG